MNHPSPLSTARASWEQRYQHNPRPWTGQANAILARWVQPLTPGSALDLGCSEGNSAVWMAQQGRQVTGVDISATALDRAAQHAADAGVSTRTRFEQHDLEQSFPAGQVDLVYALYLQSPVAFPRDIVLRQAADAVAIGGLLLVIEHASAPSWVKDSEVQSPSAQKALDTIGQDLDQWETVFAGTPERQVTETSSPDGQVGTIKDNIIALRRLKS
ncbi:class I SAM-dependent methyltransferase [Deinococcus sp. Arct2-2]|uniref:class I SAM-dependent methyltransferase n=1 Tax=Deinococcus sp. Arct2-2 TaxID=2568653 RepID=UPI0010A3413F|nr:class I SAM-dependent methyltransferase [Deinococcus sp. Arct2-2]THF69196.1 class I SAM-dependent methyltransferase [Deinococcus sp. Arct2-2]